MGVFDTSGGWRRGVVGWRLETILQEDNLESRLTGLVNGIVDWAIPSIFCPLLEGIGGSTMVSVRECSAGLSPYALYKRRPIHATFAGAKGDMGGVLVNII
jgi:hypothetical protein